MTTENKNAGQTQHRKIENREKTVNDNLVIMVIFFVMSKAKTKKIENA